MRLLGFLILRTYVNLSAILSWSLTRFFQKPVADAMRELLESFRLPGESQQISRIAETFASIYFASGPGKSIIFKLLNRHCDTLLRSSR